MNPKSVEEALHALFHSCGEDPEREGLLKTPQRFLKAFQELTQGYHQTLEEVVHGALFECSASEPVQVIHVPFFSLCEHHLLPFFGTCHMAYLPNGRVLGLSKMYRIVNLFAQRLQLQERLTQQIGQALQQVTGAHGVRIEMDAQHLCVAMRGVQRSHSWMHTQFQQGAEIPHPFVPANDALPCSQSRVSPLNTCVTSTSNDLSTQNSALNDRRPTMHRLKVRTLEIPLHIGCFPEEQQRTTPVRLEVELQVPSTYGTTTDDLSQTICYDQLMQRIQCNCLQQKFQLIEYAGASIYRCIQRFLMEQNKAAHIKVTLTKMLSHPLLSDSQYTIGDF